jgi:hypothetical protein
MPNLPSLLAVMMAPSPTGYPEILELRALNDHLPLAQQARRALSQWMESDDDIQVDHTPSGRIAAIVTYDGEASDIFAVEVPATKKLEAIHRWARAQELRVPALADFTEAEAVEYLEMALADAW